MEAGDQRSRTKKLLIEGNDHKRQKALISILDKKMEVFSEQSLLSEVHRPSVKYHSSYTPQFPEATAPCTEPT